MPDPFATLRQLRADVRDLAEQGMVVQTPEDLPRVRTVIQMDGDMVNFIDRDWLIRTPSDLDAIGRRHAARIEERLCMLLRPAAWIAWVSRVLAGLPPLAGLMTAWRDGTWHGAVPVLFGAMALGWAVHRLTPLLLRRLLFRWIG